MKTRLQENDRLFHDALYAVWRLLSYYQELFGFTAESAHNLSCHLAYDGALDKIFVEVPKIIGFANPYSTETMAEIFNKYFPVLLSSTVSVPPYLTEDGRVVEALYVTKVSEDAVSYTLEILYINNPDAFNAAYPKNN